MGEILYRDCYVFHISHKRLPTAFVIKYQQTILCNKNAHTQQFARSSLAKKNFLLLLLLLLFFLSDFITSPPPFFFSLLTGPYKNKHNLLYEKIKTTTLHP